MLNGGSELYRALYCYHNWFVHFTFRAQSGIFQRNTFEIYKLYIYVYMKPTSVHENVLAKI